MKLFPMFVLVGLVMAPVNPALIVSTIIESCDDVQKPCHGYYPPDCPEPVQCSDTNCTVPTPEAIDASPAFDFDDIGIPLPGQPAGILILRSQDVLCPSSARWDEKNQDMPNNACRLPRNNAEKESAEFSDKDLNQFTDVKCYDKKRCDASCDRTSDLVGPFTMHRNGGSMQYMLNVYKCGSTANQKVSEVFCLPYDWCFEEKDCTNGGVNPPSDPPPANPPSSPPM